VIHYGNLNSSRKFEFITEEFKSITGETGVSLRILDFITPNENSSRKNHDFITPKLFHYGKKVDFSDENSTGLSPLPFSASPHYLRIQQTNKARFCQYFFKGPDSPTNCGSDRNKMR